MDTDETLAALASAAADSNPTMASSHTPATTGLRSMAVLRYIIENPYMVAVQAQIYLAAVAVLYTAAHAALKRPPSAAPAAKKNDNNADGKRKKDSDDRDDNTVQSMRLWDALAIPVLGGCVLVTLYVLLKYVEDPRIISRVMRGLAVCSATAALSVLFSGLLHLAVSVVFPTVWASRDGRHVYRIDAAKRQQQWAETTATEEPPVWTEDPARNTPFPDAVARLVPSALVAPAWTLRALLRRDWIFPFPSWMEATEDESRVTVCGMAGMVLSAVACGLYVFGSDPARPGLLHNVLGMSVCYMGLPHISGTSFVINSLVMVSMLVYDVVMVFYTPVMVTVATSVEAPLMLAARAGPRAAMLGLGDIALPGIFVCLCLRYDQHRFYAGKIQTVETPLETETETAVTTTTMATRQVKAAYVDPTGHWGDWLWTWAVDSRPDSAVAARLLPGLAASSFPKPYFYVSMASYVVGLVLATAAVEYTHQGQPALFYLVPVMLAATWGQAAWMGDLAGLWSYTEDGSLDTEDVVVDVDAEGVPIEGVAGEKGEKEAGTSSGVSLPGTEPIVQRRVQPAAE